MMKPLTDADRRGLRPNEVTERIIGCAYTVCNTLGNGFLEKVYENALALELRAAGMDVRQQHPVRVAYQGEVVGDYYADLLVESSVIVELKASRSIDDSHVAQCINYLKATGIKVCLLLNFGTPRVQVRRIVNDFDDGTEAAPDSLTTGQGRRRPGEHPQACLRGLRSSAANDEESE
jgi:GxxExxY protein